MSHDRDLHDRFEDLQGFLAERFNGIDARLDDTNTYLKTLNGRVYEHAMQLANLKGQQEAAEKTLSRQKRGMVWGGLSAAGMLLAEFARQYFSTKPPTP